MRILFVGDIFSSPGREALSELLPLLKSKYQPDFLLVNGENAASGRGLTPKIAHSFFELGIDGITLGNHTWDNKEIFTLIDKESRIVRPANYPVGTPGSGSTVLRKGNHSLGVLNLQGRTFLPSLDCPFQVAETQIAALKKVTSHIFVDFHGEASSEKLAFAWHFDGDVSAVVGTHTHVQTNDARILPGGTAYLTDVGMTGPYDGIIGMEREAVIRKFRTQLPVRLEPQKGRWQLNACVIDLNTSASDAKAIFPLRIDSDHPWLE